MSKLVILVLLFMSSILMDASAQDRKFTYDDAGNRILRETEVSYNANDAEYRIMSLSSLDNTSYESIFRIYPNPAKDIFYVENVGPDIKRDMRLYDMAGRLIASRYSAESVEIFDISSFPSGIYILRISGIDGECTHKIIKE